MFGNVSSTSTFISEAEMAAVLCRMYTSVAKLDLMPCNVCNDTKTSLLGLQVKIQNQISLDSSSVLKWSISMKGGEMRGACFWLSMAVYDSPQLLEGAGKNMTLMWQ